MQCSSSILSATFMHLQDAILIPFFAVAALLVFFHWMPSETAMQCCKELCKINWNKLNFIYAEFVQQQSALAKVNAQSTSENYADFLSYFHNDIVFVQCKLLRQQSVKTKIFKSCFIDLSAKSCQIIRNFVKRQLRRL